MIDEERNSCVSLVSARSCGVDAFQTPLPIRQNIPGNSGSPGGSGSGSSSGVSSNRFQQVIQQQQINRDRLFYMGRMSQLPSINKKKCRIETFIDNRRNALVLQIYIDDKPFFIDEQTAMKKIYHAPDYGVVLPPEFDLQYVASLPSKERIDYVNRNLDKKFVFSFMEAIGAEMLKPNTLIKPGTLGKNLEARYGTPAIQGTHVYNPVTGLDTFFTDSGFDFHTGFELNSKQKIDLANNDNIL